MTSKQVMWVLAALLLAGCAVFKPRSDPQVLHSPYQTRRIWAVLPLRNEAGTATVDGVALADRLTEQVEMVEGIDVLPVNRVLAAMQLMEARQISTPAQARALLAALGADGLIVGTVHAYDAYDPPKIGLALELYTQPAVEQHELDLQRLLVAATEDDAQPAPAPQAGPPGPVRQPVSTVSGLWQGSDPLVRKQLEAYTRERGPEDPGHEGWRRYRSNINLYSEFVARAAIARLLDAESQRLKAAVAPPAPRLATAPKGPLPPPPPQRAIGACDAR